MVSASDQLVSHELPDTCLLRLALGPDSPDAGSDPRGTRVDAGSAEVDEAAGANKAEEEFTHSEDFRSVTLRGKSYFLNGTEAHVIQILWDTCQKGNAEVAQQTILDRVGLLSRRLRDVFRSRTIYELISVGSTKGSVRLRL